MICCKRALISKARNINVYTHHINEYMLTYIDSISMNTCNIISRKCSEFLCRGLLKDVPLRGVASAENAVYRRHYTGCVDNGMGSWMLVDDSGNSSTVFKTRNGQL